ncbi:hypothetical protein BDR04DRAFT_785275 [Suillus decipiens]|nr:hypothetical protein BDR04DRAFT_785275 [Suillus decipiens]
MSWNAACMSDRPRLLAQNPEDAAEGFTGFDLCQSSNKLVVIWTAGGAGTSGLLRYGYVSKTRCGNWQGKINRTKATTSSAEGLFESSRNSMKVFCTLGPIPRLLQ